MNEITKLTILYLIDVVQVLAMMVLVIAFVYLIDDLGERADKLTDAIERVLERPATDNANMKISDMNFYNNMFYDTPAISVDAEGFPVATAHDKPEWAKLKSKVYHYPTSKEELK